MSDWFEWAVTFIISFFAFSLLRTIWNFMKEKGGAKIC